MLEINKTVFSQFECHIHQNNIAGTLNAFRDGNIAISVYLMALDLIIAHFQTPFTVEFLFSRDCAGLKRCCYRKRFGNGTGFISIHDAEVFP